MIENSAMETSSELPVGAETSAIEIPSYAFDADRLAALAECAILDTPAEPVFDGIVQLATQICEAPVALVSLVANDRQWFKAHVGFAACETDLSQSVCAHALIEPDLLIIPDLTKDARSKFNPLVTGDPHIRFYAGAPFHSASGEVLGSLCVIDTVVRPNGLTEAQANGLRYLAMQVTALLDMRRVIAERDALISAQRDSQTRRVALLHLGDNIRETATPADLIRVAIRIVGQTVSASRVGFSMIDASGNYLPGEPDWKADGLPETNARPRIKDHVDLTDGLARGKALVIENVAEDPRTKANAPELIRLGIHAILNMPVRERGRTVAILVVHDKQPRKWSFEVLAFLRNAADRLEVGMARLKAEAEQDVLNNELSHRLKNTFAMIQAIAIQTLRSVPDQKPVDAFVQRLHALSSAHDVLLMQKWSAASIRDVVESVINPLGNRERCDISGPDLTLGPRATLSLSLLLHELMTNAIKYGSLSREIGEIDLHWRLEGEDDAVELVLNWREIGGPTIQEPTKKGFGSKLIRTGLIGAGGTELRYLPTGFEGEFRAPLAQVQLS